MMMSDDHQVNYLTTVGQVSTARNEQYNNIYGLPRKVELHAAHDA